MNFTYSAYLQSEAWNCKKSELFQKVGRKCAACGSGERVQVHHLTYIRIFREELSDLMPLCDLHHTAAEEMVAKGIVPRVGDVSFLAAETLRFIAPSDRKVNRSHRPKKHSKHQRPSGHKSRKQRRLEERRSRTTVIPIGSTTADVRKIILGYVDMRDAFDSGNRARVLTEMKKIFRKDQSYCRISGIVAAMFDHPHTITREQRAGLRACRLSLW